ncbi:DedA family protein [Oryzobacter telluris]|uniref:DedA family protein n=1 Tax=Oryzobacter telluris TaxID=3149179 RepID=UPI00370D80A3
MERLVEGWPVWAVFVVLWLGALARGTATYWVGRGVRAGGGRSRWAHHLDRPVVARAERFVRRVGPPAVTLGFLTIGLQSAINASAGMLRMPQRRFLPAVVVGAALWSTIYTTVGFAAIDAFVGSGGWWWLLVALGIVLAVVLVSRRVRRRVEAEPPTAPSEPAAPLDDPAQSRPTAQ